MRIPLSLKLKIRKAEKAQFKKVKKIKEDDFIY